MAIFPAFTPRGATIGGPTSNGTSGQTLITAGDGTSDWSNTLTAATTATSALIAKALAGQSAVTFKVVSSDDSVHFSASGTSVISNVNVDFASKLTVTPASVGQVVTTITGLSSQTATLLQLNHGATPGSSANYISCTANGGSEGSHFAVTSAGEAWLGNAPTGSIRGRMTIVAPTSTYVTSLLLTDSLADDTQKVGRIASPSYDVDQLPICVFSTLNNSSGDALVRFGGGVSAMNACTRASFFAAANNTTVTGTEVARITSTGMSCSLSIGTNAVSALTVVETTGGVLSIRRFDASVSADDMVGKIQFYAADSSTTTNFNVAEIEAQATNTIGTDINPGRLIFRTTPTTVAATPVERLRITETGEFTFADACNLAFSATTGSKIGTATGQKIGFWNATPVVQQVLATGAGATADNIISLLQTLGLCKQS